jgi:hypothetical protein
MKKKIAFRRRPTTTAAEFDARFDSGDHDMTPDLDLSTAQRPGKKVQRVNVDFPVDLLAQIDDAARRLGINRQAFIKVRIADALRPAKE